MFLQKAAAAAIITAGFPRLWGQEEERELTTTELIGLETLRSATAENFEQWIGGKFRLKLRGAPWGSVVLTKVSAETSPHPRKSPMSEAMPVEPRPGQVMVPEVDAIFLVFKRSNTPLDQETFTLDHDWLGTFDLLLVPSRNRRGTTFSTAILTRLTGRNVPL
jgi:Ser/Thr protein kinase RdoA (MazF antagonist)